MSDEGTRREIERTVRDGDRGQSTRRDGLEGEFVRGLPPQLAEHYEVVQELAVSGGAEADLVLVDEIGKGRRYVLNLHWRKSRPTRRHCRVWLWLIPHTS